MKSPSWWGNYFEYTKPPTPITMKGITEAVKQIENEMREQQKAINFGKMYGMGKGKLKTLIKKENKMYHTDREGNTVAIAAMADDHLINTIKLFSNPIALATNALDNSTPTSRRAKALYKNVKDLDEEYEQMVCKYYNRIGPYVIEATLRGLDIKEIITNALGRKSMDLEAPSYSSLNQLG